jgi:hypothetical protein
MVYLFLFGLSLVISIIWVKGIDNMKRNHSDYEGEDFLDIKGKNPFDL